MIETSAAKTPLPWASTEAPSGVVGAPVAQTNMLDRYSREAWNTQARWMRLARARWLHEWIRMGAEALCAAPAGPSARELLAADRERSEQN